MAAAQEWQLVPDEEAGNCYYFNRSTGLSTWEAPPFLALPSVAAEAAPPAAPPRTLPASFDYEGVQNNLLGANSIDSLAETLAVFFKQVQKMKPRAWAKKITDHVAFPLCSRDLVCKAFLYGERSKPLTEISRRTVRAQDWFKWVLPMFDRSDSETEDMSEPDRGGTLTLPPLPGGISRSSSHPSLAGSPKKQAEAQAMLIVVCLLHYSFRCDPVDRFALLAAEVQRRLELLGWQEQRSEQMGLMVKGLIKKIMRMDGANLKKDHEHNNWEKLLALSTCVEDIVFFSPWYGLEVKPENSVVGIHPSEKGCADKELVDTMNEFVNTTLGLSSAGVAAEVFQDPQAAKEYKKRREQLTAMAQFWACAAKWTDGLSRLLHEPVTGSTKTTLKGGGDGSQKGGGAQLDPVATELVELLAKRTSRCKKKQATVALQQAVNACRRYSRSSSGHDRIEPTPSGERKSHDVPSWEHLSPKAVLDQTVAGGYNLRRLVRFIGYALETQTNYVTASQKVVETESKKCYFSPHYLGVNAGPPDGLPRDGIPASIEPAAAVLKMTNLLMLRMQSFVQEVKAEVLAPLTELKTEYDEAATLYAKQFAAVEKDLDNDRTTLLKDFAAIEKDFASFNLAVYEATDTKKDVKGDQKRIQLGQRTLARLQKYEQMSVTFETEKIPTTKRTMKKAISQIQTFELKRLTCTQAILARYLAAFGRFHGEDSPLLKMCAAVLEGFNPYLEMERFGVKSATTTQTNLPKLHVSSQQMQEKLSTLQSDQELPDLVFPPDAPAATPRLLSCPKCTTPYDTGDKDTFCTHCGAPLPADVKPEEANESGLWEKMKAQVKKSDKPESKETEGRESRNSTLRTPLTLASVGKGLKAAATNFYYSETAKANSMGLTREEFEKKTQPQAPSPSPKGAEPAEAEPASKEDLESSKSLANQAIAALATQNKVKARLEAMERTGPVPGRVPAAPPPGRLMRIGVPGSAPTTPSPVSSPPLEPAATPPDPKPVTGDTKPTSEAADPDTGPACPQCDTPLPSSKSRFCVACGFAVVLPPTPTSPSLGPAIPPSTARRAPPPSSRLRQPPLPPGGSNTPSPTAARRIS